MCLVFREDLTRESKGRRDLDLKKNYARTDAFKFSFFNRIVDTWNVLSLSVRQASSISSFKRGVRDFLSSGIM